MGLSFSIGPPPQVVVLLWFPLKTDQGGITVSLKRTPPQGVSGRRVEAQDSTGRGAPELRSGVGRWVFVAGLKGHRREGPPFLSEGKLYMGVVQGPLFYAIGPCLTIQFLLRQSRIHGIPAACIPSLGGGFKQGHRSMALPIGRHNLKWDMPSPQLACAQ